MRIRSLLLCCIVGSGLINCAGSAGKHGVSAATDLPIGVGRAAAPSSDSGAPAGERSTSVPPLGAPPVQPLDTKLEAPGPCWLRSTDETHAWLDCVGAELGGVDGGAWVSNSDRGEYSVVLDLASGCLTESYRSPVLITQLAKLDRGPFTGGRVKEDPDPRTFLNVPGAFEDLRRYMGFAYRFGERQREGWAWSADGRVVAVTISGTLLRSLDGGRTFDTADDDQNDRHFAVQPLVTADGRWLVYWRCAVSASGECLMPRSLVALASAGHDAPFAFDVDAAMLKGLDASGNKLVFTRVEGTDKVCVDHADPASNSMTRSFCISTPRKRDDRLATLDISPKGRFATFDPRRSPKSSLSLVSMSEGRVLRTFTGVDFMTTSAVDDDGRLAWTIGPRGTLTRAANAKSAPTDLGQGEPLGWASRGRLLLRMPPAKPTKKSTTLGDRSCDLVRVVPYLP